MTTHWTAAEIMESVSYGKLYYIKSIKANRVAVYRVRKEKDQMFTSSFLEYIKFGGTMLSLLKPGYLLFQDNSNKDWSVIKQEKKL